MPRQETDWKPVFDPEKEGSTLNEGWPFFCLFLGSCLLFASAVMCLFLIFVEVVRSV